MPSRLLDMTSASDFLDDVARLRQAIGMPFMFKSTSTSLILLGLIDLAAGVVALVWPGPTAFVLVIVVAAWALVGGVVEVVAGFGSGETGGTRAMFIVAGLVSVAFGIVLFARPDVGAVTLALLFGLYSMIYGFSQITAGVQARQLGKSVQALSPLHKAA